MESEHPLPTASQDLSPAERRKRLRELAQVFLRLGFTAFGGPAAHIALMDHEIVQRRQWLTREELLDLLGITQLIPGPNSTELAIHIGYQRGGWLGLWIAGSCFILPAMGLVWGLAVLYAQYQTFPQMGWLMYGIKPVIIAIVGQALVKLGRSAIKGQLTLLAAIAAGVGYGLGWSEIMMLMVLGLVVMVIRQGLGNAQGMGLFFWPGMAGLAQIPTPKAVNSPNALTVFLFFLKIGSVLYGSGYVLLAFLQRELVENYHWLTSQQLLDAVAIGQFTPGPVFTTATFVGYLLAGNIGAIAGTVGIFLPAFLLVGLVHPWVNRLKQSAWVKGFLAGVNAASLGLMAGVTVTLGQNALVDYLTVGLCLLSGLLLWRFSLNSAWLILGGAAIGWLTILL
ncbi:MAG: chromate transporter [Microcystaceae cyanobacterium]